MQQLFSELCRRLGTAPPLALVVSVERQRLVLFRNGAPEAEWPVSTSKFGVGSQSGSFKTPQGLHRIAEKIGGGLPIETVFKARQPVGVRSDFQVSGSKEPASPNAVPVITDDLIMSRILWLDGCEEGLNRGGSIDSHDRYIYIHGTVHEDRIGTPNSHGCVRMRNADIAKLYDLVETGTPVLLA